MTRSASLLDASVPRILVGTEQLGSVFPDAFTPTRQRDEAFRFLDGLVELGCTAFDLAASYQLGGSERLFGQWMRSRNNRSALFLSGKGAHPYPVVRPNRLTVADLEADLAASLERLGTDRLDQYLVHRDHPASPLEPIAEVLSGFVTRGDIGAYGVSNWSCARFAELDRIAEAKGLVRPFVSSPQFSLLTWNTPQFGGSVSIAGDAEARAFHTARALPTLAWSPLGRGFFAATPKRGVYANAANDAKLERARRLAAERGLTPAQIALAWLFHQPFPVYAVVASRSLAHMKSNLAASRVPLTPAEVTWLETGQPARDELKARAE